MKKIEVRKGDRYGRLVILNEESRVVRRSGVVYRAFLCLCDCGNTTTKILEKLRTGHTRSCGCLNSESSVVEARRKKPTHGDSNTNTYKSWASMKARCLYVKHPAYFIYKNVTICDRWLHSFENFLEDMGERPHRKTLDRIDGTSGYCKENCRWATAKEQGNNTSANRRVTYRGKSYTVAQVSDMTGMLHATVTARLNAGWSPEMTIETPIGFRTPPKHGTTARYNSVRYRCRCVLCSRARVDYNREWNNMHHERRH